jgi:predicted NBD/HSP70 family sugar kinase
MYLLFDIGASNMRLATSLDLKRISKFKVTETPHNYSDGIKKFKQIALELASNKKIIAACGGIAGPLDKQMKKVLAGHMKDWKNKDLKTSLKKALKCRVFLENDAALAGLGEAIYGAGKNHKVVGYLTFSTGVGGVKIVDKTIDKNAFGFEPHRQLILAGQNKSWGELISGKALQHAAKMPAKLITSHSVWRDFEWMAIAGINNAVVFWSPQILIIGGGIGLSAHLNVKSISSALDKTFSKLAQKPKIAKAKLGDLSGIYGAMAYMKKAIGK